MKDYRMRSTVRSVSQGEAIGMEGTSEIFSGLTVLSLEQATVVPYLTYRLAQDGVRVIRLEHPVYCDPNRRIGEPFRPDEDRMCSYFFAINAGKEAVTVNLKEERGRELLRRLIERLDVDAFITNQLPKNYNPLGIDYETLSTVTPDLTGEAGGDPQVTGIPLPDMGTSEHSYGLLMKALLKRSITGKGSRIDMAMIDSTVSWLTQPVTMAATFAREMTRRGNTHEFFGPVSVYPTKDGYVYIAIGNDVQWKRLLSVPGFEGLEDGRFESNAGRMADAQELNSRLAGITGQFETEDLLTTFREALIPIAKVQGIREVMEDPAVKGKLLRTTDPETGFQVTMAPPPAGTEFLEQHEGTMSFPPRHGEHNDGIYGEELGLGDQELEALRNDGVI